MNPAQKHRRGFGVLPSLIEQNARVVGNACFHVRPRRFAPEKIRDRVKNGFCALITEAVFFAVFAGLHVLIKRFHLTENTI